MARRSRARLALDRRWQSGAITKLARASGKDPRRVYGGLKSAETRHRRQEHAARIHGQKARERTERALEPRQRAQRTRAAGRLERELDSGGGGGGDGDESLDDYYDSGFDEYDKYDIETSPDYEDR